MFEKKSQESKTRLDSSPIDSTLASPKRAKGSKGLKRSEKRTGKSEQVSRPSNSKKIEAGRVEQVDGTSQLRSLLMSKLLGKKGTVQQNVAEPEKQSGQPNGLESRQPKMASPKRPKKVPKIAIFGRSKTAIGEATDLNGQPPTASNIAWTEPLMEEPVESNQPREYIKRGFSLKDQIRIFIPLFFVWLFGFSILAILAAKSDNPGEFLLDPTWIGGAAWYAGSISQFGIVCWACAMASGAWASWIAHQGGRESAKRFLLFGAIVTAVLMADDLFGFHSGVFEQIGIPKLIGEGIIFGPLGLWLVIEQNEIRRTRWQLLFAAIGSMFLSVVLDRYLNPGKHSPLVILEDGPKFMGILAWSTYFFVTARDISRSVLAQHTKLGAREEQLRSRMLNEENVVQEVREPLKPTGPNFEELYLALVEQRQQEQTKATLASECPMGPYDHKDEAESRSQLQLSLVPSPTLADTFDETSADRNCELDPTLSHLGLFLPDSVDPMHSVYSGATNEPTEEQVEQGSSNTRKPMRAKGIRYGKGLRGTVAKRAKNSHNEIVPKVEEITRPTVTVPLKKSKPNLLSNEAFLERQYWWSTLGEVERNEIWAQQEWWSSLNFEEQELEIDRRSAVNA